MPVTASRPSTLCFTNSRPSCARLLIDIPASLLVCHYSTCSAPTSTNATLLLTCHLFHKAEARRSTERGDWTPVDVRRWPFFFPRQVGYGLADLRGDVFGGITAGSIALPAAIGYGVISGLGPTAGLYGAVAVSFFAGVFGGTRGLISGPNILVTLVMAAVVAEYAASIEEAVTVAILAGLIQMAFGLLGLGRYALYLPSSLTSGFFSGFGVLLLIKQGLLALGSSPAGSAVDNLKTLPSAMADANYYALALAAICVALGLAWRGRLARLAPAPFVVLVAGTVLGVLWFRDAPAIGNIPQSLPVPELPAISLEFLLRAVQPAFAMAPAQLGLDPDSRSARGYDHGDPTPAQPGDHGPGNRKRRGGPGWRTAGGHQPGHSRQRLQRRTDPGGQRDGDGAVPDSHLWSWRRWPSESPSPFWPAS